MSELLTHSMNRAASWFCAVWIHKWLTSVPWAINQTETFIVESVVVSGSQWTGIGTGSWQRERCDDDSWELDAAGVTDADDDGAVDAVANVAPFAGELQSYAFIRPRSALLSVLCCLAFLAPCFSPSLEIHKQKWTKTYQMWLTD